MAGTSGSCGRFEWSCLRNDSERGLKESQHNFLSRRNERLEVQRTMLALVGETRKEVTRRTSSSASSESLPFFLSETELLML